jgi:adhesin/invasin
MVRPLLTLAIAAVLTTACDYRAGGLIGVTPPATQIVFVVQPSDAAANAFITPGVEVHVRNNNGQTVPNTNVPITLTLIGGTAGANLLGAAPVSAVNGVASFPNLRIDQAGVGYQLMASANGFQTVASRSFNVTP